jgi:hypothetical protein
MKAAGQLTVPLAAVLCLLAAAGGCADRARETAELLATMPHPRLLFRKADLAEIKETVRTLPEAKARWEKLRAETDPGRKIEYPAAGAPTQPDWARVAGRMGTHAARCGILYQMTGDRKYALWARRMLLGWAAAFETRVDFRLCGDFRGSEVGHKGEGGNTMGFFFAGYLLAHTALAYDCIRETLSADDRETIERDYFARWVAAIESYDYSRHMPGKARDFMVAGGQWNGANLCNMGLTAVGFVLGDGRLVERGIRNFKTYLGRDMLSDGFWIEEDRAYSDLCLTTLFNIAWMARSCGYPEDLFNLTLQARDVGAYDGRYATARTACDGRAPRERSLAMYLDAQVGYQYPTLGPGNWGWMPGRGSLRTSGHLIGLYEAGYAVYGKPQYAFILGNVARTRGSLGMAGLGLLVFGRTLEAPEPPAATSRWYPHGRWVILRSTEGADYWGSDALYAFVPYGTERPKGLQPLSLDLFGFGRVLAPRTTVSDYAQNLTKSYQLNEPAWNTVMVDGCIVSTFRGRSDRSWMAYHSFGPLVKVAAPRVHRLGERRRELHTGNAEWHPEENRVMGRTLALTDTYLVDVFHVTYDQWPKYKHNFDYVLHGVGKLAFERSGRSSGRFADQVAVWTQEPTAGSADGKIGLRSTILSAMPRGGTKLKKFADAHGQFLVATRANYEEWFVVVHEPLKGAPRLVRITPMADEPDHVALEIRLADGVADYIALRTKPGNKVHTWDVGDDVAFELKDEYVFLRLHPNGRQQWQRPRK